RAEVEVAELEGDPGRHRPTRQRWRRLDKTVGKIRANKNAEDQIGKAKGSRAATSRSSGHAIAHGAAQLCAIEHRESLHSFVVPGPPELPMVRAVPTEILLEVPASRFALSISSGFLACGSE